MSIRTVEQLYDHVSDELAWRRKELSALRSMVELRQFSGSKRDALLRSSTTLLYAHWEGFLKCAANAYAEFVAMQRLAYKDLSINFIALAARKRLSEYSPNARIQAHQDVARFFLYEMSDKSDLPYKNGINTKSNLSSVVLREIINTLGFDYSLYETKEKLIDERLVAARNNIAHGSYLLIDEEEFIDLYDNVLSMMNQFRNQIDNSASQGHYKAT